MKKLISLFTIAFCFFLAMSANAQNVNVNPGAGSYPTLKAAFDAINAGTHTGAVTVDIILSTVEPLMATLNASGVGAASYTSVVIAPSGGAVTVNGSDTVTIKLAGADNVTIDGRIAGTGRNLSVLNTSILANSTAIWLAHGGFAASDSAGAKNNVIRNCEIACGVSQSAATTVTNGILSSGTTRTTNGRNNDNNQYLENRIIKCRIGISLNGGSAVNLNDDNSIVGNTVGPTAFGPDEIGGTGIFVQFQNRCNIEKNLVQFVGGNLANTTSGADRVGIGLGQNSWTSTSTSTTSGSNNTIQQNIIHDIIEERTFSALGIVAGTTLSGPKTNNLIANNVIYNVRANSTPGDQCIGIGHTGGPGDRIVFNSISLTGDLDPAGAGTASTNPICAGISKHLAAAADTAVLISDNSILVDVNTNTTTLLKAAIIGPAVGYAYGSGGLNNNDYWLPNFLNGNVTGITGTGTTPTYITLANWQAAYTPAQDAGSIQADPLYVNAGSNLQPSTGSPLLLAGAPKSGITTDILGVTRNSLNPTIGAYENALVPPTDVGVTGVVIGASNIQIISVGKGYDLVATVKNFGPPVTVDSVFYTVNGGSPVGPLSAGGPIPTNGTVNVTFNGGNAFTPAVAGINTIKVYTSLAADANNANDTTTVLVNVQQKIAAFPYIQTFTAPTNWTVVIENAVGTTALWGLGICTNPDGKTPDTAATSNCFNGSAGRVEILRSPEMDISSLANPVLNFYVAYKTFTGGENDSMDVLVSTNGGVTFFTASTVYQKSQNTVPSLATRPPASTSFFPDSAKQWRHESISLANVAGSSNLVIGFRSISDFGNRQWVDNVIVDGSDALCTDAVTLPGPYNCNSLLGLDFNTVGLRPLNAGTQVVNKSGITNKEISSQNIVGSFNSQTGSINVISNNQTDNPTGGAASVIQYNNVSPGANIANNTTATAPNLTVFTPSTVYADYWFRVTYTGNDYLGYANYDVSIDLTTLYFSNPDALYIMKRTDQTGAWSCVSTTRSGTILTASGLDIFSDFAIGGNDALPVELASFVSTINGRNVDLNWSTTSENNNSGFDIERSSVNGSWSKIGNVAGNGTTTNGHSYSYTDRNVATGNYSYRLKQIDFNGNFEYFNLSNEVIVGIPTKFDLSQNYPNPFNPSTKISFDLPVDGKVSLKIFDMSGKEIMTLVNEVKTAGYYSVNFNASNLSSGVYFYSISAGNFTATKKMMLLK